MDRLSLIIECLGQKLAESGALQLTLANLSVDHYPYHEYGTTVHSVHRSIASLSICVQVPPNTTG